MVMYGYKVIGNALLYHILNSLGDAAQSCYILASDLKKRTNRLETHI